MLSNISWSGYLITIAILTVFWYAYVFFRFYAGSIKLKHRNVKDQASNPEHQNEEIFPEEDLSYESAEEPANEFIQVETLIEELRSHIETDSQTTIVNTDLAADLKKIIAKYPDLKDTPYRSAINDLILAECARYGTDTIDEDDVDGLWE